MSDQMTEHGREQRVLDKIEKARRRAPRFRDERITMAHGAGGKASRALVEGLITPILDNDSLRALDDAAMVDTGAGRLAITTDSFVVRPLRFPGGSIGELAVNGTVNDLVVSGARPVAVSAALILEEGLPADVLRREIEAMADASRRAGVDVVTGDTKVVERGKADGLYITTTGIGVLDDRLSVSPGRVAVGDRMLVSGTIGDHGTAVLLARGDLEIEADVSSDTCALTAVVDALAGSAGDGLHCMRDATRGGVATVACEIATAAEIGVVIDESSLPIRPAVAGAGEILGIDPLYVANEGKLVAFVAPQVADAALDAVRATEHGADARLIGEVVAEPPGRVLGRTSFGGHRMIDMLVGDPLPRIC